MMKAGMNIARMNFSHGTYDYHQGTIDNVREAVRQLSMENRVSEHPVGIALDTKGPEIRTTLLAGGPTAEVELVRGASIKVTTNDEFIDKSTIDLLHVDYKNITKVVAPGSKVYIDDGLISLVVKEVGKLIKISKQSINS